jgi:hypothetical protein
MTEQIDVIEPIPAPPVKLNLFQKIHAVMQDVEYLQKDDNISFGQTKYRAISEEKVTSTVRASLLKHGLVILPVEQDHHREGTLSTVNTKYKIVDIDTGNYEVLVSSGTGADTQDKGVGKAMTYSYKYLLLRTFAIPTGEDPDKISSAELDAKQNALISSKELGDLKVTVLEFAKLRGKTDADVYEALHIADVTKLTSMEAKEVIAKVKGWIVSAKKEIAKKEKQGA